MGKIPAVSVIIPLYNVEKYVGECLESLLSQTLQDFEVIVVDDCSTDNSVAVVKSYIPQFDGRLHLTGMKKNSGGAGFPRNKGIKLARGEYIYCLDPDDTINPRAFEKLYSTAKDFSADIVQCEKWYYIPDELWHDAEYRKNPSINTHPAGEKLFTTKPVLLTDDFEKRIIDFSGRWLTWSVCLQLIRRDFIFENKLEFGNFYCEDMCFSLCEIACAKRYVVIPDIFYNYRSERKGSAVNEDLSYGQHLSKNIRAVKYAVAYFDNFFRNHEFFSTRPKSRYDLINIFMYEVLSYLFIVYDKIPFYDLDDFLKEEFGDGENVAFTAFIFNMMNFYRINFYMQNQRIIELEKIERQDKAYIAELEKLATQFLL